MMFKKTLRFLGLAGIVFMAGVEVKAADEINCLALNIYFEAGIESRAGKIAVANVTINRRESNKYPNTICDSVYQNKQFSWTHDGKPDSPEPGKVWQESLSVAWQVYRTRNNGGLDPTNGSLNYHADYVKPIWRLGLKRAQKIGRHIFYYPPGR